MTGGRPGCAPIALTVLALAAGLPLPAAANPNWQMVLADTGRRMELDRASLKAVGEGRVAAWVRIIFDKPMIDPAGGTYSIVEALNRYDCGTRTFLTLRRVYRRDEKTVLREEENQTPADLPVRTGTLDEKVFKIACRPAGLAGVRQDFEKVVQEANQAAAEMRKANEAVAAQAAKKDAAAARTEPARPPRLSVEVQSKPRPATARAATRAAPPRQASRPPDIPWAYDGPGAPGQWAALKPEFSLCGTGRRQSPIDLVETIRVDQPEIEFRYRPSAFRIADTGRRIEVTVGENGFALLGKDYRLSRVHFHRPGEHRIDGREFAMSAHLEHRAADGELAMVAVNLVSGREHPQLQTLLNHLPLERYEVVAPASASIDLNELLPAQRGYFSYIGSLTVPPCSEGVLWLVMKTPVEVSEAQLAIFARLHAHNARPLQPGAGRHIKVSR